MSKVTPLIIQSIREKFSNYTKEQCEFALQDIDATFAIFKDDSDYVEKLNAERDAAIERLQKIHKQQDTKEKKLNALLRQLNVEPEFDEIFDFRTKTIEELVSKAFDLGKASK